MIYGWFCHSLDKSMSTLVLCREVFIYENFLRRQENVTQISCKIEKLECTRVGTLIVATIYLQLIQNRYMFRSFTLLQCSHQHCVQVTRA